MTCVTHHAKRLLIVRTVCFGALLLAYLATTAAVSPRDVSADYPNWNKGPHLRLEKAIRDGLDTVLKLDDGSLWEVDGVDSYRTSLWQAQDRIVVVRKPIGDARIVNVSHFSSSTCAVDAKPFK
jgi:hypothetical protein